MNTPNKHEHESLAELLKRNDRTMAPSAAGRERILAEIRRREPDVPQDYDNGRRFHSERLALIAAAAILVTGTLTAALMIRGPVDRDIDVAAGTPRGCTERARLTAAIDQWGGVDVWVTVASNEVLRQSTDSWPEPNLLQLAEEAILAGDDIATPEVVLLLERIESTRTTEPPPTVDGQRDLAHSISQARRLLDDLDC